MIETRRRLEEEGSPLLPPPAPTPGTSKEDAHANLTAAQEKYADILRDPNISPEVKAAVNPGFNPGVAEYYQETPVLTDTYLNDLVGRQKAAKDLNTSDASNFQRLVSESGGSTTDLNAAANQFGGITQLAAGVTGLDGKYNQDGTNAGLPYDYSIVGSSDGSQEVWGPDGKVYGSVAEAQASVPGVQQAQHQACLLYTSPSPRDRQKSRMPSSA